MAEPVRRMERAFFERLALVRSGGDSIRRSMAASSFYAAVDAVREKKNGGSNRTAVKKVLLRAESRLPRGGFFLFCRWADHRGYKNRADNIRGLPQCYRLCVLASGSLITEIFCCRTLISVSCLHFGQYSGNRSSTVSYRIRSRVLLPHTGHIIH